MRGCANTPPHYLRRPSDDSEGAIRIIEESEPCQIDLFTRMSGLCCREVIGDADRFSLSEHTVPYASKASLIR